MLLLLGRIPMIFTLRRKANLSHFCIIFNSSHITSSWSCFSSNQTLLIISHISEYRGSSFPRGCKCPLLCLCIHICRDFLKPSHEVADWCSISFCQSFDIASTHQFDPLMIFSITFGVELASMLSSKLAMASMSTWVWSFRWAGS